MDVKEQPKRCPFCGGDPIVLPRDPKHEGNAWGRVRCTNPDCPANLCVNDDISVSDDRGSDAYKEAAIRVWNRVCSAADRWIPVTERLPENDGNYLVVFSGDDVYVNVFRQHERAVAGQPAWIDEGTGQVNTEWVSHWRPLPEPPAREPDGKILVDTVEWNQRQPVVETDFDVTVKMPESPE